jgi:hypothetical protein
MHFFELTGSLGGLYFLRGWDHQIGNFAELHEMVGGRLSKVFDSVSNSDSATYPKLLVGSEETIETSEPAGAVVLALLFFVFAPASGVIAGYNGWLKTGLAIHSLWVAGIIGVCIGVGPA